MPLLFSNHWSANCIYRQDLRLILNDVCGRAVHTNVSTTRSNPNSLTLPSVIKPSNTPRAGKAVPASRVELQPQQTELPRSASKPFRDGSEKRQADAGILDSETRPADEDTATDNAAPAIASQESVEGEDLSLTESTAAQQDASADEARPAGQGASSEPAPEAGEANEGQAVQDPEQPSNAEKDAGAEHKNAEMDAGAENTASVEEERPGSVRLKSGGVVLEESDEIRVVATPPRHANRQADPHAEAGGSERAPSAAETVSVKSGGFVLEESDEIRVISTPPRPANQQPAPNAQAQAGFRRAPSAEAGGFGRASSAEAGGDGLATIEETGGFGRAPSAADGPKPGEYGAPPEVLAGRPPRANKPVAQAEGTGQAEEETQEAEIKRMLLGPPQANPEPDTASGDKICLVETPEDERLVAAAAAVVVQTLVTTVVNTLYPPSPPPAERRLQALASPPRRKEKSPPPNNVDPHLRIVRIATVMESTQFEKQEHMGAHAGSTIGRLLRCTGLNGRADGQVSSRFGDLGDLILMQMSYGVCAVSIPTGKTDLIAVSGAQFSCMAGVALGPGGLLFVADKDRTTSHHEHDVPIVDDIPLLPSPPVRCPPALNHPPPSRP